jgi:hypothetical protein
MFIDEFEELFVLIGGLLFTAAANGLSGAVVEMILHESAPDASQSFLYGGDLDDDIGAIALLFHHLLETADLPFDSAQALQVRGLDLRIDRDGLAAFLSRAAASGVFGSGWIWRSLRGHLFIVYTPTPYIAR